MVDPRHPSAPPPADRASTRSHDGLLGVIKVHVLHRADREPVYGLGLSTELARRGYHFSPGTLYPLLHSLEAEHFLERDQLVVDGKVRKYYAITPLGRRALEIARQRIVELVRELADEVDDA
jgi:PadR family transcriptional regulator, regulatory protein PadR